MKIIKKILSVLILIFVLLNYVAVFADTETVSDEPNTKSGNVLLMDNTAKRIIYDKNGGGRIAPGGFAKILTAIVVLENINDVSETVSADSKAVNAYDFSLNNMGVLPGENLSAEICSTVCCCMMQARLQMLLQYM